MLSDGNNKQELIERISELYGFRQELIRNLKQCGLWSVNFVVNGIKYNGAIPFYGALPILSVSGYATDKYDNETPVEDWYYDKYIKDRTVKIIHFIDKESGNWEDTGIRCADQETARQKISEMKYPSDYNYNVMDQDEELLDRKIMDQKEKCKKRSCPCKDCISILACKHGCLNCVESGDTINVGSCPDRRKRM